MKRSLLTGTILLVLVGIGAAGTFGYLAVGNSQAATTPVEIPITIKVTRGTVQQTVSAPGTVLGTEEVALSLPVGGRIATLRVRAGTRVKADAILLTLDTNELQRIERQQHAAWLEAQLTFSQTVRAPSSVDLRAAQAALFSARATYSDLVAAPSTHEIAPLQATLRNAQATLQQVQSSYETAQDRSNAALALEQAKNNFTAAQAAYDNALAPPDQSVLLTAQSQIAAAEAHIAALQPDPDVVAQAKLKLEQANTRWQQAVDDIARATLTAPFDGVVLEIDRAVGENVPANSTIMRFADPTALEVQAKVIEEDLPLVQIGQTVEVYFDAVPDLLASGPVTRINPLRIPGDRPMYGVYIALDTIPTAVLAGMSSDVAIIIARHEDVLQLPRAMVRSSATGIGHVEVWKEGKREKRQVKVGLRGDVYAEIVEGLKEGDEVVSK